MAGFFDIFTGSSGKVRQTPRFDQNQMAVLQQLLSRGMQGTDLNAQRTQANTNFYQNTVPSLAERFTGLGGFGDGGQRSSGFQQALGSAGAGLNEDLAAQGANQNMNFLQMGLQPKSENNYFAGSPGMFQTSANYGIQGLMKMLPFLMM